MNILDAMRDPQVFGSHFRDAASWRAWRAFLGALFGLPMHGSHRDLFTQCTGRAVAAPHGYNEAWVCCGRRSGKSFILSTIAVYLASFRDWRPFLAAGEKATIAVIASDRKQSRVILSYIKGLLQSVEMLAATIESETAESITLSNKVVIEVHTSSFRSVRGYTVVAALLDEIAFWPTDEFAADPDTEVINALKPAMATIPGAMLLCASSPYGRKGALWQAHQKHYGKQSRVLVWQAKTTVMNPTVPQDIIDAAIIEDAARANAEWMAEFRLDVETFVSLEAVDACISHGTFERPPLPNVSYRGYVDIASGSGSDSAALAIAHREGDRAVLDVLREVKPKFSAQAVVQDFADVLKRYGLNRVTGDKYGAGLTVELFMRSDIRYVDAPKSTSDTYLDFLPAVNCRLVDLLDNTRCVQQLTSLQRRTGRGRDSIDHPPNAHDDLACACAGALTLCLNRRRWETPDLPMGLPVAVVVDDDPRLERARAQQANIDPPTAPTGAAMPPMGLPICHGGGGEVRRGGVVNWRNLRDADW